MQWLINMALSYVMAGFIVLFCMIVFGLTSSNRRSVLWEERVHIWAVVPFWPVAIHTFVQHIFRKRTLSNEEG